MDQGIELVQQPVQGLGQNGEHAVVFDQFQAWGQGLQQFLFLRANKDAGFQRLTAGRGDVGQLGDHAHRVQIGVHLAHEQIALDAVAQQPDAGEVVLHHGHVAILGLLLDIDLVLLDLGELHFLVLLGLGVNRWAGEGGVERGLARRLVAIAHELQIELGRDCRSTVVDDLVLDG